MSTFPSAGEMKGLKLADNLSLPREVAQEVTLILGTRGCGKCLDENSKVLLENGIEVPIKDIDKFPNIKVVCLDITESKFVVTRRMELTKRQVGKMLSVKVAGRVLRLTPEHPLLSEHGWKPAVNFVIGDRIATRINGKLVWSAIETVEVLLGEFTVYDIGVPDHHNFIAEGVVVHNSYTLGVLLEELHKNGMQWIVWDALGAHRKIVMPNVAVISIKNGMAVNMDKLVEKLMNSNQSIIVNMMDLTDPATTKRGTRQQELVGTFATKLLNANPSSKGKVIVTVIEEAEEFAPNSNAKWTQESIVPLNRLTKLGRARGCGVIFVTQRPQDMSARLRSQVSNFIVHRLTNYTELEVMQRQLVAASRGDTKEAIKKIFNFRKGEALVLSQYISGGIAFVKIRQRETEHAGANVLSDSGSGYGGYTFSGKEPGPEDKIALGSGSMDDLKELIMPMNDKPKADKLDVAVTVLVVAAVGLTGYMVYDYYKKKQYRAFDEEEDNFGQYRQALYDIGNKEKAEKEEAEKEKKKKKGRVPELEDIGKLDKDGQAVMDSSMGKMQTGPVVSNYEMEPTGDPFFYDPYALNERKRK